MASLAEHACRAQWTYFFSWFQSVRSTLTTPGRRPWTINKIDSSWTVKI